MNFFNNNLKFIIYLLLSISNLLIDGKKLVTHAKDKDIKQLAESTGVSREPEVWLTVSSLAHFDKKLNQTIERQLMLNWKQVPVGDRDLWIGLFNKKPDINKLIKLNKNYSIEWFAIKGQASGSHRTKIQFPYKKFSNKNLHLKCLNYWIALIDGNKVLADNCLKINPFWMQNSLDQIGHMSLLELMIPGTHNSGSYDRFDQNDNTLMNKYTLCQDETIFNQLVYGIRFLDLRVGYDIVNGNKSKLWIVHGPVPMKQTLDSVLRQVKRFIGLAPKEVVIVDLHRFEKGFNKDEISERLIRRHHRKVLAAIVKHLGQYLVPRAIGLQSTLNQLVAKNQRIVIGYAQQEYVTDKTFTFTRAKHLWPNTDDIEELVNYFNDTICDSYPNELVSAMAQLTADKFGIFIDRYDGLRTMAQTVNNQIINGFTNDSELGWANCANVVASDYFLGNNLIDISLKTNLFRSTNSIKTTQKVN